MLSKRLHSRSSLLRLLSRRKSIVSILFSRRNSYEVLVGSSSWAIDLMEFPSKSTFWKFRHLRSQGGIVYRLTPITCISFRLESSRCLYLVYLNPSLLPSLSTSPCTIFPKVWNLELSWLILIISALNLIVLIMVFYSRKLLKPSITAPSLLATSSFFTFINWQSLSESELGPSGTV